MNLARTASAFLSTVSNISRSQHRDIGRLHQWLMTDRRIHTIKIVPSNSDTKSRDSLFVCYLSVPVLNKAYIIKLPKVLPAHKFVGVYILNLFFILFWYYLQTIYVYDTYEYLVISTYYQTTILSYCLPTTILLPFV